MLFGTVSVAHTLQGACARFSTSLTVSVECHLILYQWRARYRACARF